MLRNLLLWYISLLSIERYTKHMVSHEYLATFSPLTVDIILPGILLIVIVQATAPLYGWGKYDYLRDTGFCSAATISTFGCSYALYLLFSLTLPPVSLITINAVMLSSKMFKKTKHTSKRNIPSGNSRIFTAEKEIIFLIIFTILFILMSIPRCIIDVAIMCSGIDDLLPTVVFLIYFLDSLTDVLLPIICLGLHPRARQLLCDAFRKNIIESPDMHLT